MEGVRASNRDKSGVIVREIEPCWVRREFIELPEGGIPGVVGLGVDQENAEEVLKVSLIYMQFWPVTKPLPRRAGVPFS